MNLTKINGIKGVSDRRRLPRLGKIRLGLKVRTTKGTEYPKEVSYFVCPDEVKKIYGEQPTVLDIYFPTDDSTQFFPQSLKLYKAQGLICKGDGENALRKDEVSNELIEIECPCENEQCNAVGNLMVLLPRVSIGGVYQIDTGSISNIIAINSYIDYLRNLTGGRISMIPLKLRRIEQEMTFINPTTNKQQKSVHYLLQMELPLTIDDINKMRNDKNYIPPVVTIALPVEDGRDLPEVIIDESELKQIEQKQYVQEIEKTTSNKPVKSILNIEEDTQKKYINRILEYKTKIFATGMDGYNEEWFMKMVGNHGYESLSEFSLQELVKFGKNMKSYLDEAIDVLKYMKSKQSKELEDEANEPIPF